MSGRLWAWLGLVGVQILLNYSVRASQGKPDRNAVYHYSTAVSAVIFYGVVFVLLLAIGRDDAPKLLALRRPSSWGRAVLIAAQVIVGVIVLEYVLNPLLHPDKEQGLTPKHWESSHAAAFALSFIALAVVGPFVEEATFRGIGYSLFEGYGQVFAVVAIGVLFGLAHGLVEALPILVALGIGLAYLRARTDSLYPCVIVHGAFNTIALILAVTT